MVPMVAPLLLPWVAPVFDPEPQYCYIPDGMECPDDEMWMSMADMVVELDLVDSLVLVKILIEVVLQDRPVGHMQDNLYKKEKKKCIS